MRVPDDARRRPLSREVGPLVGAARARAHDAFVAGLATRPRPVVLRAKAEVPHQRLAHHALRLVTFGGQDRYATEYVTTIGHVIYLPAGWESRDPGARLAVLRHELVHVEQFERLGALAMTALYTFGPLPVGLAYGRAQLELEAYRETIFATLAIDGVEAACSDALRAFIVERFVGPDYLYMWPFRGQVDRAVREIQDEARGLAEGRRVSGA